MPKQTTEYREEERLTCVLVLDSFNIYINELVSHTGLPLCLWPVDGKPLLDYTIHTLVRSGIQEIILVATTHSYEIRSYVMNSHWLRTNPKLIKFISCTKARSLGDCLKDLEQENIINNHFLLLHGNGTLLTNEKLNDLFQVHKENIKRDKNCVMTLVYRQLDSDHVEHPSYTDDQYLYILRDVNTNRLYDYSNEYRSEYEVLLDLLEKPNVNVETLYCPLDCHLAVCSTDVLHLFKDNFDFLTINEFVKGVLRDEEIAGHTIYSHLYETGYFLSVHNLHSYMKGTFDVLRRWSYPVVPEILASASRPVSSTATTPASPRSDAHDPHFVFSNLSYPVTFDKHNIYKQGDIQLDRLSDIQQNVFIGHKSQIQSGVCLRSTSIGQNCVIGKNTHIENSIIWNRVQIGEGCIIKNSIICDNVQIRDHVKIDKECILCKGVIVGGNIHLDERMTIVASTGYASSQLVDDVEIDDDVQLAPASSKRSNSRQRRNSRRLSEKSVSDRSICSSMEDALVSNSDLVGEDGMGRELVFTCVHDERNRRIDQTDDDDDDDDDEDEDDDDKDLTELNGFDAWGSRIKPFERTADGIDDDHVVNTVSREKRTSKVTTSSSLPVDESSDDEVSANEDDASTENGSGMESADESEFQFEAIRTLKRAFTKKVEIGNVVVELNMLKPTFDVSPTEFDRAIIRAVLLLPLRMGKGENINYWNVLKSTMDQTTQFILKNYMKTNNELAQMSLLNELEFICLKYLQPIGERIEHILTYLYENDVIDERWILKWNARKKGEGLTPKPEEKIYSDKLHQFIHWLETAESEDDDDDDEE